MPNPSASRDTLIGELVGGRYEVVRLIGKGGTGSIYEVRNVRLGHSFALKTLTGEAATNEEAIQRFRREADIVARIKHPNIVEVIDWDELADGSPCIVMEYLRGTDLARRIEEKHQLPWSQIAIIADQVLAALATTHASGVVHRDLKPHNVFLAVDDSGEERVKLLDFGVSKIRDSTSLQTMNDRLVGTPSYMAPEQAEGRSEDVGPHTDIWAMAIILHEMATGVRAFEAPSLPAILYAVCHGEPAPISKHRADAPAAFVQLIADALVRPIDQRLADVAVMRTRLRDALRDVAGVDYSKMSPRGTSASRAPHRGATALADTLDGPPPVATSASSPSRARVATTQPTSVQRARPRWPIVAALAVLAGGIGILAVVLSNRSSSTVSDAAEPAVAVVVRPDGAAVDVAHADDVVDGTEPTATGHDAGPPADAARAPVRPVQRPRSFADQVTAAVSRKMDVLGRCVSSSDASETDVTATIEIAPDGKPRSVALAPASVASSPFGECARAVLVDVEYPSSERGGKVALPLRLRPR